MSSTHPTVMCSIHKSVAGFLEAYIVFFFMQKTAYEMRISDWSSDVCSSDLPVRLAARRRVGPGAVRPEASADRLVVVPVEVDRKSVVEGTSVSVRVDLGGRRIITKK